MNGKRGSEEREGWVCARAQDGGRKRRKERKRNENRREEKGSEGKRREVNGSEGKRREEKGREGKGS